MVQWHGKILRPMYMTLAMVPLWRVRVRTWLCYNFCCFAILVHLLFGWLWRWILQSMSKAFEKKILKKYPFLRKSIVRCHLQSTFVRPPPDSIFGGEQSCGVLYQAEYGQLWKTGKSGAWLGTSVCTYCHDMSMSDVLIYFFYKLKEGLFLCF